jgi:hypothetical protein
MKDTIPFFYYDILARIIPGAMTLATLLSVRDKLPESWKILFVGSESWKAVVVPLVLGALSYVIGVIYEAIYHAPPVKQIEFRAGDRDFERAWRKFAGASPKNAKLLLQATAEQRNNFRFRLWEKLTLEGGRDQEMGLVFAHCHRFQAEYKMFLHLIYPSVLFAVIEVARGSIGRGAISLMIVPVLFYLAHRRDERRWDQVLSFADQLNMLTEAAATTGIDAPVASQAQSENK